MELLFSPRAGQVPLRNLRRQLKHGQLFWREIGQGKTVVFRHGSWRDGDQWSRVLSVMGPRDHCMAPALAGLGEADRLPKTAYSLTRPW